jgi:hypothetical protein
MDEKMLILLGLGAIGYLALMNINYDDDDDECEENDCRGNYNENFVNAPHSESSYSS